jgi:hypothetical protein
LPLAAPTTRPSLAPSASSSSPPAPRSTLGTSRASPSPLTPSPMAAAWREHHLPRRPPRPLHRALPGPHPRLPQTARRGRPRGPRRRPCDLRPLLLHPGAARSCSRDLLSCAVLAEALARWTSSTGGIPASLLPLLSLPRGSQRGKACRWPRQEALRDALPAHKGISDSEECVGETRRVVPHELGFKRWGRTA